jgi:glycogen(starch) synthase
MIVERYGIRPEKVSVVYNAVSQEEARRIYRVERRETQREQKMVLFLGRITFQKGPDYFVEAAARVLQVLPEVRFVMAGSGDMIEQMIERVAELGIGDRFHFTGFLQGEEIERIFALSDLYVMPSVSEPFGISPLEAMLYDVPVIISRQSGVAEILRHALKINFWDVREIAAKIIAVLKFPVLSGEMAQMAREELRTIRWENAADRGLPGSQNGDRFQICPRLKGSMHAERLSLFSGPSALPSEKILRLRRGKLARLRERG